MSPHLHDSRCSAFLALRHIAEARVEEPGIVSAQLSACRVVRCHLRGQGWWYPDPFPGHQKIKLLLIQYQTPLLWLETLKEIRYVIAPRSAQVEESAAFLRLVPSEALSATREVNTQEKSV